MGDPDITYKGDKESCTTHTCTAVMCRRRLVTLSAAGKLNDSVKCAYLNLRMMSCLH